MATEKRLIDAKGKFVLNAGDLTGHIMCFANGCCSVQIDLDMGDEGYCSKGRKEN